MSVTVKLAPTLQRLAKIQEVTGVEGQNVRECLQDLKKKAPRITRHLYGKDGHLSWMVMIFVNGERVFNHELDHRTSEGDEIHILLGLAGG